MRRQDTIKTDHDIVKIKKMLKQLYQVLSSTETSCVELRQGTDRRHSPLTLEEVITMLEENHRLEEGNDEVSRSQGKTGSTKSNDRDKKGSKQQPIASSSDTKYSCQHKVFFIM
jgi:hypothetical protein